jgi:hypothetical protein
MFYASFQVSLPHYTHNVELYENLRCYILYVTYVLKSRTVEPKKQPLLGNACMQ